MLSIEERIRGYEPFFGKWSLASEHPLGEGTSGIVYSIHDGVYEAALKVIPIPKNGRFLRDIYNRTSSEDDVRRELERELSYVKDEIKIMRLLEGESNIVYFTDSAIYRRSDTYGWDVLICMEKLVRIDQFLKDPKRYGYTFNANLVMHIWTEMVNGLCVCESNDIVHFDIKPENIFYAPGKKHFKLGDFGVAVNTRGRHNVMQGGFVGTRDYASPEMWNRQGGDSRSDIYSLAMVIYQLLNNNRLPFMPVASAVTHDDFVRAFEERVKRRRPIPPIRDVKPEIMRILLKCLEYEPDNRYSSFELLRRDLMRILYGAPVINSENNNKKSKEEPNPKKKSLVVPIVAVAASLGVAGAMVAIGMGTVKKDKGNVETPPVVIATSTAAPVVTNYQAEATDQLPSPVIEEATAVPTPTPEPTATPTTEPTPTPEPTPTTEPTDAPTATPAPTPTPEPGFAAHGNLHNYFDENGQQMLVMLNADISGEVQVNAILDGNEVPVNRINQARAQDIPGNWNINAKNWPADGVYFITQLPALYETHNLSIAASTSAGSSLYSEEFVFHLEEINGEIYYMSGEYVAPLKDIEFTSYGFNNIDSYVGPKQSYTFFGIAEPNSQIQIYLNASDNRIGSASCDSDGNWSFTLDENLIKEAGGSFCLLAGYEGEYPVKSAVFIYDDRVSEISINGPILADSVSVSGTTEANANVAFSVNGVSVASCTADANGNFKLDISDASMFEGDTYVIVVTDHVGNTDSISETVGRRSQYAQIQLTSPVAGVYGHAETINVCGSAQAGEKLVVAAEEIKYEKKIKVGKDGSFDAEIQLPDDIPAQINLVVRYENTDDGYASCALVYDTSCALTVADTLAVCRAEISIESEPSAVGSISVLNSEGYLIGELGLVCDESGKFNADLSHLLPLEGDRVVVSMQDIYGNTATQEVTVHENSDLTKLMRVDADGRQINEAVINAASIGENHLAFVFEGYPASSVILQVNRGEQGIYSCYMAENEGVYSADLSNIGLSSGEYTVSVRYEKRPDKLYTTGIVLAIDAPAITITTDASEMYEGMRSISGFTSPECNVSIFSAEKPQEAIATNYSKMDGEFTLTFNKLEAGDYIIKSIDKNGNSATTQFTVAKRIDLTIARVDQSDGVITANVASLTLYGEADPNREIVFMINGNEHARFHSGSAGWSYSLDTGYLPEGKSNLSVKYASAEGESAELWCEKDSICNLEVTPFDESAQFIMGSTDADAAVGLFMNETLVAKADVQRDGQFAIDLVNAIELPIDVNQQFVVRAVDSVGNTNDVAVQANRIVRDQITLKLKPEPRNGFMRESKINISGKAAANTDLKLVLSCGEMSWQYGISAKIGEYSLDIELPAEIKQGEVKLRIDYADGFAADSGAECSFYVDRAAPVLTITNAGITAGMNHITGTSDDTTEVRLYINGKEKMNGVYPNSDGSFMFKDVSLKQGDVIYLASADAAGNEGVSAEIEVGNVAPRAGGYLTIPGGEYSVGDTLHVEGWMAYGSVRGIQIRFYHNGEPVRGVKIAMDDMQAMSEEALNRAISSLADPIDAQNGYTFSKDIVIGSDWLTGVEYDAALYFEMAPEPVIAYSSDAKFSVAEAVVSFDVNSTHIGSNYAFGLDAQQPAEKYNSGNIVLSGWVYADSTVSGEIVEVMITAADGSSKPIICAFDERIKDSSELATVDGVYYCRRVASAVFPNAADYGLGAVVPTDENAGFVLAIDQDLPDGDYILTFYTTFEGRITETISTVISIDNSVNDSRINYAGDVLQRWANELAQRDAQIVAAAAGLQNVD